MRRLGVGLLLIAVASGGSVASPPAEAVSEEPERRPICDRGPFRIRNQFPLNLHFLSLAGEDAAVLERGRWAVSADLTSANVFVASEEFRELREGGSRRPLSRQEFEIVLASDPGLDRFFFDGEVTRLSVLVRYSAAERVEVGLEVPYLTLGGGGMDGLIESFHDGFGLDQAGRLGYPRDRLQIALALGGARLFEDGSTSGLGDAVVFGKALLHEEGRRAPAVALRLAVKPATGGSRSLLSSGHTDYGAQLALAKHLRKRSLYFNLGRVASGGWWAMPAARIADPWMALVAYEQWLGPRASLVIQDLVHESFLADATPSELGATSHEVTVGAKFEARWGLRWAASLTENYATFKSSPDFGVHVGVVCSL